MLKSLLACLLCTSLIANAADFPRMWEVSGQASDGTPTRFYLLAITHNGLPTEYDSYYQNTVLPLLDKVDVLSSENSTIFPMQAPACPTPLAPTEANRALIAAAHERIEAMHLQHLMSMTVPKMPGASPEEQRQLEEAVVSNWHGMAHTMSTNDSEYGLIIDMNTMSRSLENSVITDDAEIRARMDRVLARMQAAGEYQGSYESHLAVNNDLMKRRPDLPNNSIDTGTDVVDAYCSIAPERRGAVFKRLFDGNEIMYTEESLPRVVRATQTADLVFRQIIRSGKVPANEFEGRDAAEGLVCVRNPRWVAKMLAPSEGKVTLYSLGVAHLFPFEGEGLPCDDLLTALRKQGLSVSLVQ